MALFLRSRFSSPGSTNAEGGFATAGGGCDTSTPAAMCVMFVPMRFNLETSSVEVGPGNGARYAVCSTGVEHESSELVYEKLKR